MKTGEYGHMRRNLAHLLLAVTVAAPAAMAELPELECLIEPFVVIDIGSPAHGIVDTLAVERSDVVKRDDVLAKLDSSQQSAAVRTARARAAMESEIRTREAELALAERKQQRMRELYDSDAISSHARDEVETELKRAQMQLRQARDAQKLARIELERARDDLERRTIRSPISGVIVERFVAPGEYVNEKPLMRLAQLHPLRIEALAPATLFGKVEPGMLARVATPEGSARTHSATVTIVDKMIDAASGTFGIRLELPNPDYAIPSGLNCRLQVLATPPPPARTAAVTPAPAPLPATAPTPEPKATGQPPEPTAAACRTFGPFPDANARDALAAELEGRVTSVRIRDESAKVPNGYLVLTHAQQSIEQAHRTAAELKTRGIDDLVVLTRKPYAGHVALGWYKDKANARARQQALSRAGVETQLHERLMEKTLLWLDAQVSPEALEQTPWNASAQRFVAGACDPQHYVTDEGIGLARTSE